MIPELRTLGEVFQNKKIDLLNGGQRQYFVSEQIDLILSGGVIDYDTRVSESEIINNGSNISYEDMLKYLGINVLQLEGKNIVDIGGGFSIIPFLFNGMKGNISIVDPIFKNDILKHLNSNKKQINNLSLLCKNDNLLLSYKKILNELNYWDDLNNFDIFLSHNGGYLGETNLKLIADIELANYGIAKNSADIIFINHVITKSTVNPFKTLDNAFNILKKGGKCYITENDFITIDNCEGVYENFYIYSYHIRTPFQKTVCILEKK
ncbi:MAG: hypothetical protein Q8K30_06605 [Candidatus Gracilibacteria bacterium]|nr:hypothetical protein [Candidatus Gracilibacteria bacterium]